MKKLLVILLATLLIVGCSGESNTTDSEKMDDSNTTEETMTDSDSMMETEEEKDEDSMMESEEAKDEDSMMESEEAKDEDSMMESEEAKDEDSMMEEEESMTESNELPTFTLAELATFNGENGQPAYVAVAGVVYDVSNHPRWQTNEHNGNVAGTDLTEAIKKAPHGTSKLKDLPVVGKLAE